jgi:hypothetical protein
VLALSSGDPAWAICSTLIAGFPILPAVHTETTDAPDCRDRLYHENSMPIATICAMLGVSIRREFDGGERG